MTTPNVQMPYLITSRKFPQDPVELEPTLSKMYFDVASAVNARQIGIFDHNQLATGERWFNDTEPLRPRQSYRKAYQFGAIAAGAATTIDHGLTASQIDVFTHIYGACRTAAPDWKPIPFASVTAANQSIQVAVTNTQIVITNGAGASNITSGIVVIEYILLI